MKTSFLVAASLLFTVSAQAREIYFNHLSTGRQQTFANLIVTKLPVYIQMQEQLAETLEGLIQEYSPDVTLPMEKAFPSEAMERLIAAARAIDASSHPEVETEFARDRHPQSIADFYLEIQASMDLLSAADQLLTSPYPSREYSDAVQTIADMTWIDRDNAPGEGKDVTLWVNAIFRGDGCGLAFHVEGRVAEICD
jgi:hypothetical protein